MQNQPSNEVRFFAPVCESCQTRDETLRAVTYPFVFSVVVMTFQRRFSGVFCAKHQRRYHLLASLITAAAGWLGIPYGLFLTPLTLIKLARGGIVHSQQSAQILNEVADKKISTGDVPGAIRCLEESLKLQNNPLIRERLARLYQQNPATDRNIVNSIWQVITIPILLAVAGMAGLLSGIVNTIVIWLLAPLWSNETSIIVAILSWLPTVLFLFSGILIARALLRWSLQKISNLSVILGSLLNFTTTSLFFYGMLQGEAVLRNLQGLFTFFSISIKDGIFALRSVLVHGGLDILVNDLNQGELWGIISTVLLGASISLSLYVGIEMVLQTSQWQNRVLQVRQMQATEFGNSSFLSWSVYGLSLFALGMAIMLIYPGSYVNVERIQQQINLGLAELDKSHFQEAAGYFSEVSRAWPDSVTSHTYLGLGHSYLEKHDDALRELDLGLKADPDSMLSHLFRGYVVAAQGKFVESVDEFEYVTKVQPQWGLPHAFLAVLHYNLDEPGLAQDEIEKAIQYQNEDGQTISLIGAYYSTTLDFKKAEEYFLKALKISNDPRDYLYLARIYTHLNEFEKAQKIIDEADRMGADPAAVCLERANLAEAQNDLSSAEKLLKAGIEKFPENSNVWAEISYVHFEQGRMDSALHEAITATELNPYNSDAYSQLAFIYQAQGNTSEALAAAQKSVQLYPKYDRSHYILGVIYMDQGMREEAITEFESFMELYWDRPLAQKYKENAEKFLEELK